MTPDQVESTKRNLAACGILLGVLAVGYSVATVVSIFGGKQSPEEADDSGAITESTSEATEPEDDEEFSPPTQISLIVAVVMTILVSLGVILVHFRRQMFSEVVIDGKLFI